MIQTVLGVAVVVGAATVVAWMAGRVGGQLARLRPLVVPSRRVRRRR